MQRRAKMVWGIVIGVLAVIVAAGAWMFWKMGEASYRPGALAAAAAQTRAGDAADWPLDPAGPLSWGADRPDGSREFSLDAGAGVTLRGFAVGSGSPVLVVHGGPGFPAGASWAGLDAFAGRHRFWYWDQRGSGRSDRPVDRFATGNYPENLVVLDRALGLGQQVADIERLRRAIGVERIDLVGHSFGGLIACLYAIEFPAHAGRILLVAPAPMVRFPPASGGLYEAIRRKLPEDRQAAYAAWLKDFFDYGRLFRRSEAELRALNAGVMPYFTLAAARYAAARGGQADARATGSDDPALAGGWMMQAIFFSMGQRHDWSRAFAGIMSPVGLVYGTADLAADPADLDQYRVIPGLRQEALPGADHFVLADAARFAASPLVREMLE